MFEASVTSRFSGAHRLRRPGGEMEPLHAHDWCVTVTYSGEELDRDGLLVDFGLVRERLATVLGRLERRNINCVAAFEGRPPSAERVAAYVAGELPEELPGAVRLKCVEVEEEPGCVARYIMPVAGDRG